jgi:hypothetical protein
MRSQSASWRTASLAVSLSFVVATSGFAVQDAQSRAAKPAEAEAVLKLSPAVTAAELEFHVRFLAADERKGRMTGSPEADQCASYLSKVFEREGLLPAGDAGTYLERVPLVRMTVSAPPQMRFAGAQGGPLDLAFGVDFNFGIPPKAGAALKLVQVKAKSDLPATADPKVALFVDATTNERRHWLEDAGLGNGAGFGLLLVPGGDKPGRARDGSDLNAITRATGDEQPVSSVHVNGPALERLRSGTVATIDIEPHIVREVIQGSNVVARIAGVGTKEHPDMARETLVVTAHYDHLDQGHAHGGATATKEDVIYNGADDDASGVAAVLEIAGAMAKEPPPARSVLFVLVTGEEIGLLGTEEYLDHPLAPLKDTVANLNFEMIGRPDPKVGGAGHLWLTGFDLTNLGPAFAAAKLEIAPDPYPKEHFYERSDNIAFVHRGVIGQTLSSYNLHTDYHTPADEADKIDFVHMEGCTQAGLAAVEMIASGALTPQWVEKPRKSTPKR